MKKIILLLLVALGSQVSFAQSKKGTEAKANSKATTSTQTKDAPKKNDSDENEKITVEQRATNKTERLHAKVNLTQSQKTKVNAIYLQTIKRNDDIRKNKTLSDEEKKAEIKASNEQGWKYIEAYLTKDQLVLYKINKPKK
jgi:hypothetical protein